MKRIILIVSLIFIITGIFSKNYSQTQTRLKKQEIDSLWHQTISVMLKDPLWKKRDAYDAGHFLMVPMHCVFESNDKEKIKEFDIFFYRFLSERAQKEFDSVDILSKLHFLYLLSQYLVLSEKKSNKLINYTVNEIKELWYKPIWNWGVCRAHRFNNMKEIIEWRLKLKNARRSYCRAITGRYIFTFAIAADIKTVLKNKAPKFIDTILDLAYKVMQQEVVFIDKNSNRWLFQPGVWDDYPDFMYSGWKEIRPNLPKKPIKNTTWDSSHSHRFPLWLLSLQHAYKAAGEKDKVKYIKKLRKGLEKQFFEEVLVPPSDSFPNYRVNNFMDGYNGIYRYNYRTQGKNNGYGPYELSGTLLLGWWAFLPGKKIRKVYCYIAHSFPLSDQEIKVYLGPDTTRDRHPIIKSEAQYKDGVLELISKLICYYKCRKK